MASAARVPAAARSARGFGRSAAPPAEHQLDDPVLRARRDVDDADRHALAEDGRPVADRGDLDHAVGDEDDRAFAAAHGGRSTSRTRSVRFAGRAAVISSSIRTSGSMARARARSTIRRDASGTRRAIVGQVQVGQAELSEPVPERLEGRLGETQVGPDVQVRDQGRLLVDRDEAAAAGLERASGPSRSRPRTAIVPAVGPDRTGEDLDERALAGAVGAHERVDLAGTNRQGRRSQGDHGAVRLRDVRRLEQEVGGRDGHVLPGVRCGEGMPATPASPRSLVAGTA